MAKINRKNAYQKPSDRFWRENFMKVLKCLAFEELTWSVENWQKYGVSTADRRRIEQEYRRWDNSQSNKAKDQVVFSGQDDTPTARG